MSADDPTANCRMQVRKILTTAYTGSKDSANVWFHRWRIFYIACRRVRVCRRACVESVGALGAGKAAVHCGGRSIRMIPLVGTPCPSRPAPVAASAPAQYQYSTYSSPLLAFPIGAASCSTTRAARNGAWATSCSSSAAEERYEQEQEERGR